MASPFTPSTTDGAIDILRTIFGPVMDSVVAHDSATAANASANMLGAAFGYFNTGVLFFGSLILMFVTVFGISNSANDGVALGKKWSTFYTPLRTLVSAAALIPTASGYAGIQLALLLIVSYSVGFASNMWKSVVEETVGGNIVNEAVASVTSNPNFDEMIINALRMQICAQGVNSAMQQVMPSSDVKLALVQTAPQVTKLSAGKSLEFTTLYYQDPNWRAGSDICGSLTFHSTVDVNTSNSFSSDDIVKTVQQSILTIRTNYAKEFANPNGAVASMARDVVTAINDDTATIDSNVIAAKIYRIREQYDKSITAAVKSSVEKQNASLVERYTDKGWIYAGSLWREISRIKDAVRSASFSQNIEYVNGSNSLDAALSGQSRDTANQILSKYTIVAATLGIKTAQISVASASLNPTMPKIQTNFTAADFASGSTSIIGEIKSFFSTPGILMVNGVTTILARPDQDPILRIKDIGDYMAGFAETVMLTKALILPGLEGVLTGTQEVGKSWFVSSLGTGVVAGVVKSLITLITELYSMMAPSLYTLLYAGYFLGIWIPMIPFYVFALGVVGWLIFVVEMLAAGVLWMAAHTTPAREDSFIGSQTQGYLLVLSGFFRPALMVLGLVASNALMEPMIHFVNEGFKLSFMSLQADSMTGLLSVVGYLLVYATIVFSVITLIFSLPQTLPDRILKWIGAGIGDMGEQNSGSRIEQNASSQARTAAVTGTQRGAAHAKSRDDAARSAATQGAQRSRDDIQGRIAGSLESMAQSKPEGHTGSSNLGRSRE